MGRPTIFVAGDTASVLRVACKDDYGDGTTLQPVDLTGAVIKLKYRIAGGALQTKTMSLVGAATDGVVEYKFGTGELTAGDMIAEVEITFASGDIVTSVLQLNLPIRAKT